MPLSVKHGDTRPVQWRVVEKATREPIDLTGASAEVHVRLRGTSGAAITLPATIPAPQTEGQVQFETDTLAIGTYDLEIEITASNGDTATAPTVSFDTLIVGADLA